MGIGWIVEQIINFIGKTFGWMQTIEIIPYYDYDWVPGTTLLEFCIALLIANIALSLYFRTSKNK